MSPVIERWPGSFFTCLVGREGFEPPTATFVTPDLQSGAFSHFATYPHGRGSENRTQVTATKAQCLATRRTPYHDRYCDQQTLLSLGVFHEFSYFVSTLVSSGSRDRNRTDDAGVANQCLATWLLGFGWRWWDWLPTQLRLRTIAS